MAKFLDKLFGNDKPKAASSASMVDEPLELPKINDLIRHFPIGEKVRYYPEHQKDGTLDTLILGYGINGFFVYAPQEIRITPSVLRLFTGDEHKLITELESFSLLIPYNPDDENKRDYHRRAELGPRGAFRRRNTITLVANGDEGVLSHLDTRVRRILSVEEGIYTGHQVVILDVIPSTLSYSDQRRHYRVHTRLPATLHLRDGGSYPCTLLDFSEKSVRLAFDEADMSEELQSLSEFRRLTLGFDLGNERQPKTIELDGTLYRRSGPRMVIRLQGIYRDGRQEALGLVDVLAIKSGLLKHPATLASQQADDS